MKTHPSDFVTLTYQSGFAPDPSVTTINVPSSSIVYVRTHSGGAIVIWAEQNNMPKRILCTESPATIGGAASGLISFTDATDSSTVYINANGIHFVGPGSSQVAGSQSHLVYDEGQIKRKMYATETQAAILTAIAATDPAGDYVDLTTNQTVAGNKTFSGEILETDIGTAVTAFAGGGQGSATVLGNVYSYVTTVATDGDSVKLPPATGSGARRYVVNQSTNNLDIFPDLGDTLAGLAVDNALTITPNDQVAFIDSAAGGWEIIYYTPIWSSTSAISAAGTTQGAGTVLNNIYNRVATVTAGVNDAVTMASNEVFAANNIGTVYVENESTAILQLFPDTGGQFNTDLAADASIRVKPGEVVALHYNSGEDWNVQSLRRETIQSRAFLPYGYTATDWVMNADGAFLDQSATASEAAFVFDLQQEDIILNVRWRGDMVEPVDTGTTTLDGVIERCNVADPPTQDSLGALTQVAADGLFDQTLTLGTAERVVTDKSYQLRVTGTTAASDSITITHVEITVLRH